MAGLINSFWGASGGFTTVPAPFSYYKCETDFTDETGLNNSASEVALTDVTGIINNGQSFNGTTSYANFSTSDSFNLANDGVNEKPFSIQFWTKMTSSIKLLMYKDDDGGVRNDEWVCLMNTVNVEFYIYGTGGGYIRIVGAWGVSGSWNHMVITYDGSKTAAGLNMYANGGLASGVSSSGTYTQGKKTASDLNFGKSKRWGGSFLYDGIFDEIGFWNVELTSAEATSLYNSGSGLAYPFP